LVWVWVVVGIAIIIVDAEDKIRTFLPQVEELVEEGLIILDPVEVIRYAKRPEPGREQA
jgi:PII-like signaling protein